MILCESTLLEERTSLVRTNEPTNEQTNTRDYNIPENSQHTHTHTRSVLLISSVASAVSEKTVNHARTWTSIDEISNKTLSVGDHIQRLL